MTEDLFHNELRHLIAMARASGEIPLNLRLAWSTLGELRRCLDWPAEMRHELNAINSDLEKYIGHTELAKFGHGQPPDDVYLDALIGRVLALEQFLPSAGSGDEPA